MKSSNIEDIYPLSPMQEGMLFHSLYAAHAGTYVLQVSWNLRGALDVEAWKRSWQEVCDRHAALRSAFAWEKLEAPVQIVWKRIKLAFDEQDLRALPPIERVQRAARYASEAREKGFDPTRAPLFGLGLLRLADDAWRFVFCMHHLVLDGWSMQIVVKEVLARYAAHAAGAPVPAFAPARPYGAYIRWLAKRDAAADAAFWARELEGFAAPTSLGIDRKSIADAGAPRFGEVRRLVPEATSTAITAFARRHGLTSSTVIHGAWAMLLARYSGEEDVLFGSTVSGRSAPIAGIEEMVGLFINTLPVRVRVSRVQSAIDFLIALQRHEAELREHEHSPLAEVQTKSAVPRGTPLFESLVVFENVPLAESASGAGVAAKGADRALAVSDGGAEDRPAYPLSLVVALRQELLIRLGYDAQRFEAGAIERMCDHLVTLLEGIVAAPQTAIGRLPMLTTAELRALVAWNETSVSHGGEALLHQLVEAQIDRTPEAVAVVFEDHSLTYRALEARANRVAHRLRALGVGPDVLVFVCLDRSLDLPAAMLGVLKAGGAYVPVDPSYPKDRIADMLRDAEAPVLITDRRARAVMAAEGAQVILVDDEEESVSEARPAPAAMSGEDLAYVIYTSGSTGRPKGVMIPHRAIVNHMRWMARAYPLGAGRAVLQKTPISFDASVWEIWLPLMSGARLVMARPDGHRDPRYLVEATCAHRITDLQVVPSMLEALVYEPELERCTELARVFAGGEALSRSLVERLRARVDVEVVNLYGPTECAVQAVVWTSAKVASGVMEPIGRPIDNVKAYVLDAQRERVPVGVPGELYLGGACVGRGYLGRPELTAERFVADPFERRGRMYRTGDRCRIREDGVIEYLGRADDQIKLRGFRIELGEIEALLVPDEAVREAVVATREDAPGDVRLVAYVVAAGERPSTAALDAALRARLPEHMMPSAYVMLDALPRAPSGKIDRRALPSPDAGATVASEHVAPRSPVEQAVCGIFADVIKVPAERVGVTDGFFALGGHSLLATQALTRIRAAFGIDLTLRALFEAPTAAAIATRIEAAIAGGARPIAPPIVPVPRAERMPPSFGQERLWFLHQLDPSSPAYVVPLALRLSGRLDVDALARALSEIVRRHEVLRTTFVSEGGRPAQVIHPPAPVPLPRATLGALSGDEREQRIRAEATAEARRPFDLERGPLLRARLLEVDEDDTVLLLTMHHIVSDIWTSAVVHRELSVLYGAFTKGEPSPLPELSVQYADYAVWQRGFLAGAVLDEQLAYWRSALEGAPSAIELPTDRPRPKVQSFRGATRHFVLPTELTAAVKELARREGATLYMTLLAAYDVLLHRYSGQDDIVVGTPIAGRTRAETEGLVGFFLNTLVMRARLAPDMTFKELLAHVKETALGAYAHQDMPFERLVPELAPEPDPSRSPLFQVIFNLQNAPREGIGLGGVKIRGAVADGGAAKVDLALIMTDTPRGLAGRIDYATDLFEGATIERFVRQLETLLASAVRAPQTRVRELEVLPDDERRRLLVTWNDKGTREPITACYHEIFEAQVDRTPDAIALVAGAERLSYRELDVRANRLAHRLRALGVGPDVLVGLCTDRTADLVVAVLGIFKAGGAYVPIEPGHPARRIEQILGEARISMVVTQAAWAGKLSAPGVTVVQLDADAIALAAESEARPAIEMTPRDLAYVLFTSGSTGTPKGVAIEHQNLVSYVRGVSERMALPAGAAYAYVSTFAADLGHTVLFPSLAGGGCLHVVAEDVQTDPDRLGAYVQRAGIDVMKIVPSHLSALLSGAHPERVIPRRLLVLGGEASSFELVDRIERLAPDCRIMNHYGPTETTVGVLTYPVARGTRPVAPIVPLGQPLPDCRVYVLDAHMKPAPTGVPGEIYIGGRGVARGYLNDPERTRARFVADPFDTSPGARLYKTGDRARWLSDGSLLFLGRIDFQVKIRGFRVELGEIESALRAHPGVQDVVVLALDDGAGGLRLVAHVVPRSGEAPSIATMTAWLEQRLPAYMIPAAFVILEALPLTPNGKVDRRALAAVEARSERKVEVGPRNPVEDVLAGIWADVFERASVGVHERFGDLGGHSLLAIQIIARARDAFDLQIPLRAIFEAPTIAELGERIEAWRREGGALVAPPIERARRAGPLPLSFAQERLWLLDRLEPNRSVYNVLGAVRLSGPLDVEVLSRALAEVVHRHEVLRTTFTMRGAAPVQVIHERMDVRPTICDLGALPPPEREARVRAAAAEEAATPFDLARGPLLRAKLLRLDADAHVLLLSVHHIVSDAQAQSVLHDELGTLYDAFVQGEPSPLPELPVQYADFAAWQRRWLSGEVLEKQLAYWRSTLAGAVVLDLPTDRPRPPTQSFRGARHAFGLGVELRSGLVELSRREGATLFMTVLAAFEVLLQRWSGQHDFVVGTPAMQRTRAETEGLIGCFLNTLAIRAQIDDDGSFRDLVRRVRETCLGAYAHQDLPFERLVQELAPERDPSRTPLFQAVFTLQGGGDGETGMTGVRRRRVGAPLSTAKFDLTLFVFESPRGMSAVLEYATDLFDAATIERMGAHLVTLLHGVVAAPDRPLRAISILPEAERALLTTTWNATAAPYPREATIASLVAAQAERTPEAVAVSCLGRALTYRALDAQSNQLARYLRARGVGPEARVGLAVERTEAMVVALLGILKAGGAYVPLDPTYPRDRSAFMAKDAGIALLVTEEKLEGVVPESAGGTVRIDAEAPAIASESVEPIDAGITSASLAYVIYTSGSTGKPKGVRIPHRAVVNLLVSMAKEPGMRATDRLLALSSLSFDIAGLELWLPLSVGARVEIGDHATASDGAAFARRLLGHRISVMQATPSTFRMLVDAGWKGDGNIKLLVGGEAVPRDLADALIERAGSVWNMYGPTETTIWSCMQRLEKGAPVRIGKPIANTQAYVLDARGDVAPVGVPGELCIGGEGLADGYFDRPELTAERFVPDPFGNCEGACLYRTGDRARWRAEGGSRSSAGSMTR
ncbi:Malonyl CoA-acyl carrier protein transacylase [Minicystis rosea]|nr:Malonyl CoA-acyl carrier protein transacylase [Minicystis rosea]